MSGGIGHVLVMLANLKNNKSILKKRKSFKDLKKDFRKVEISSNINEKDLTEVMQIHRTQSLKFAKYNRISNYLSLLLILTIIAIFFYLLIVR